MTEDSHLRIAVLGLGTMGSAMARRLIAAGHDVRIWNRSPNRTDLFADTSAQVFYHPSSAVADADIIITMLFDAAAVRSVVSRSLPAAKQGAIWMQSSTVGVAAASEFARLSSELGLRFADAPVLGTRGPAENGTLTALIAADDSTIADLSPVLSVVASKVVTAGTAAPAASALKLAANAWIATITAGIGQSLTIAQRLGIDPTLVLQALDGSAADSVYAQVKGRAILAGDFEPQFTVAGLLKDVRLARAETPDISDTLLGALKYLYAEASTAGAADEDIAAVWKALQK